MVEERWAVGWIRVLVLNPRCVTLGSCRMAIGNGDGDGESTYSLEEPVVLQTFRSSV